MLNSLTFCEILFTESVFIPVSATKNGEKYYKFLEKARHIFSFGGEKPPSPPLPSSGSLVNI
jgi:hypothetical protein